MFIVGKTILLKQRAAYSKRNGRMVCYLSLGACDELGNPLSIPLYFDLETADENMLEGILVDNAYNLCDCREAYLDDVNNSSFTKNLSRGGVDDDLKLVINKYYQLWDAREITVNERDQIMNEHGMDDRNVDHHVNMEKKCLIKHCSKDVFQHLLTFLEQHPETDVFIDEMPILQNRKSKISAQR